nr:3071_t:CDS:2 [Entrophospora candida]
MSLEKNLFKRKLENPFPAGYSALSFALTVLNIKKLMNGECSVLAYDCRGHGHTITSDDSNLSLDRLSQDLVNVLKARFGEDVITKRDIFLIGHSMGGCVVSDVASKRLIPSLTCLANLDVVEGTIRNLASSKVSVPSLFKEQRFSGSGGNNNLIKYVWITDLATSQKYWEGWFTGLSEKFLSARAAKLLLLAGTDRLDKPLTIAQMQGKYQLIVFPDVGHMLHEDAPGKTASTLVEFWKRNERLVLPIKKP